MSALLTAVFLLLQAPAVDEKKIQELLEKCGSEDIEVREAASRELYALGEPALPVLEKAAGEAKGEVKARLDRIISELTLPARWIKDLLENDWNQVYQRFDQAFRSKELEKVQATRVVSAVILNESVASDQREAILSLALNHRVRDFWPALIQVMARDDYTTQNYYHYLQRLRPPKEAAEPLLKAISKMQNSSAAWQLLELARSLKPEPPAMEACLTTILEGDDANLKANVTGWIQQGRYPVSMKTLLKWWRDLPSLRIHPLKEAILRTAGDAASDVLVLLSSPQLEDAALAVEYVGRQRVAASAAAVVRAAEERVELRPAMIQTLRTLRCEEELKKWIADDAGPGRRSALALAGELGWPAAGPEVIRALDHADASVRRAAAAAAGALRLPEAAARLSSLLKDADGGVRRAALVSLAMLRKGEATAEILANLRSDDVELQAGAVESLPYVEIGRASCREEGRSRWAPEH